MTNTWQILGKLGWFKMDIGNVSEIRFNVAAAAIRTRSCLSWSKLTMVSRAERIMASTFPLEGPSMRHEKVIIEA